MRQLRSRVEGLEKQGGSGKLEPRTVHLIGRNVDETQDAAIRKYVQEYGRPVEDGDEVIFLVGVEPERQNQP